MKKLLILLLMTAFILAGCAKSVETATPDQTATPDKAATADETMPNATELNSGRAEQPVTEQATQPPADAENVPDDESGEGYEWVEPTLPVRPHTAYDELAIAKYSRILNRNKISARAELDAAEIYQYPELPTGCESVALTIAVNTLGYDLGKTDIADKYMLYGDSFVVSYCGDPYSDYGAGIFPPGLIATAWNYIDESKAKLYPVDTTDLSLSDLYKFIDAGYPVVVWTTVYMAYPYDEGGEYYNDRYYPWYDCEHCVCMYGYDTDNDEVMISDPQRGKISVSASEFEYIYDEIGRFSMVLIDTKDIKV